MKIKDTQADAARIDEAFRHWINDVASQWWRHPQAQMFFRQIHMLHDHCRSRKELLAALRAANGLVAYQPDNPIGPLYLGVLFFMIEQSFPALDYYDRAYKTVKPGDVQEWIRTHSRLADAYEMLGDIEHAVSIYKIIPQPPPEAIELLLT